MVLRFNFTTKHRRIFFASTLYCFGLLILIFTQQIFASSSSNFKLFVSNESNSAMDRSAIFALADPFTDYTVDKKLEIIAEEEVESEGNPIKLQFGGNLPANLQLRNYTDSKIGDLANYDDLASYKQSNLLIDEAPKPDLAQWGMIGATYVEHLGDLSSRNAILVDFKDPVSGFGGFFGDLRTRTDGKGVPAIIKVFDDQSQEIYHAEIKNTNSSNKLCGDFDIDTSGLCGRKSSKFIGIVSPQTNISKILIVMGEDKAKESGYGPHFSLLGLVALMPKISLDYQVFYDKDSDGTKDAREPELDLVDYQITNLDTGLENISNNLTPGEYRLELSISPEDITKYQIQNLSALKQAIKLDYGENILDPIALNSDLADNLDNSPSLDNGSSVSESDIKSDNLDDNKSSLVTTNLPKTGPNNQFTLVLSLIYSTVFVLIYRKKFN